MNNIRILIVEDHAETAMDIERSLIKMDFCVVAKAPDYDSALDAIETKNQT